MPLVSAGGAQDASPFPYGTVYAASHTARLPSAVQQTADALECELVARRALAVAREVADKRLVERPRKHPPLPNINVIEALAPTILPATNKGTVILVHFATCSTKLRSLRAILSVDKGPIRSLTQILILFQNSIRLGEGVAQD